MRTSKQISDEIKVKIASAKSAGRLQNEGADGYDYTDTPEIRALMAAYDAAKDVEFRAEWTPEVTAARRAEWNESGVTPKNLMQIESRLGYTLRDLKKAVEINK